MPNVGPLELAIILIIALVIFGPKKLPELGRSLGRGIREFRHSVSGKESDDADAERHAHQSEPAELEPPPPGESDPVDADVVADNRS